jgi:hypothetical protein
VADARRMLCDHLAQGQERPGEEGRGKRERELEQQTDRERRLEDHIERELPAGDEAFDVLLDREAERQHDAEQPGGNGRARAPLRCPHNHEEEADEGRGDAQGQPEVGVRQITVTASWEIRRDQHKGSRNVHAFDGAAPPTRTRLCWLFATSIALLRTVRLAQGRS